MAEAAYFGFSSLSEVIWLVENSIDSYRGSYILEGMYFILLILVVLYILLFLLSIRLRDNSIVDVFWGAGFMVIAILSFLDSSRGISQIILTLLIVIWGIRIVSHI